jgi:carboxylesterase
MKRLIHPQAEPFFFKGDQIGCLLIHGFTSATADIRLLGEHLAAQGRTVVAPRLFGHGTQEEDLDRAHYQDWLASAEDGYHLLRPHCHTIFVGGLSVGGALSFLLASRLPVAGVFGLATAYKLPDDPRLALARPISLVYRRVKKSSNGDWWDDANSDLHYSYPHYPTPAVIELTKLLADMRQVLPTIEAPALLIQAKRDSSLAVPAEAMPAIAQALGSPDVSSHWLERSGHVITLDSEREQVFSLVSDFINRIGAKQPSPEEG